MILGPISIVGTVVIGAALLWSVRLVYGGRQETPDDLVRLVLTIGGWTLIQIGVLSIAIQLVFVVPDLNSGLGPWLFSMAIGSLLLVPGILTVFGMAVARYRNLEWTSLMWLLCAASQQGIPLSRAVRCYALERSDELGIRAARLADFLEQGVALPDALDRSRTLLPIEGLLAARYGAETGDLGRAIAGIARGTNDVETVVRGIIEKCFYLSCIIWVILMLLTFLNLSIIPILTRMFSEFEIQLPRITVVLLQTGDTLVEMGWLVFVILLPVGISLLFCLIYYLGWFPRDVPLINRLTRRYDGALIMRALAVGVQQNRPINRVVWMLARLYPRRGVRGRLQKAGEQINNGGDWCDSLLRQKLIRRSDAAVLKAAQRVGNLEWALDEMADSALRRMTYRLLLALNTVFPIVILIVGAVVALIAVGIFHPLVRLISSLV